MSHDFPKGADRYWNESARLTERAKSAQTSEARHALLRLAGQWEKLALKAATSEQSRKTLSRSFSGNVADLEMYRAANHLHRQLRPKPV
jgi:hypothetical protein